MINNRPSGRGVAERNDCVIRAIATVTDTPYTAVAEFLRDHGFKRRNCGTYDVAFLRKFPVFNGWRFASATSVLPFGRYYVSGFGHSWCVIDGVLHDTFRHNRRARGIWLVTRVGEPDPKLNYLNQI